MKGYAGGALLANPGDQETLYNYVRLQFLTNPAQALLQWSSVSKY